MTYAIMVIAQNNAMPKTLPSGLGWGTPMLSTDGRIAMPYDYCDADVAFLQQSGATLCDSLPSDFIISEVTP